MGVSFKVAKTGTRFRPKPPHSDIFLGDGSENLKENSRALVGNESNSTTNRKPEADTIEAGEEDVGISGSSMSSGGDLSSSGEEVSFTLNLYPDGYSIAKPSEKGSKHPASLQDIPKLLHPYDRTSESLFSAIESGQLPGDILDDIPSKYFDGALVCEVWDYRKYASEPGSNVSSADRSPIVNKVHLRMSSENVVKDIPLISDESWTYSDLMEVESRILKALQPQLCLDPTPMLDRLCVNAVPTMLNLGLSGARKRRLRQMLDVTVLSNNQTHGKKVCIDRVPESSNFRAGDSKPTTNDGNSQQINEDITAQNSVSSSASGFRYKSFGAEASAPSSPLVSHKANYQLGIGYPRTMQDCGAGTIMSSSGASPTGQDLMISYTDSMNSGVSSFHGKRETENAQLAPLSNVNKRARQTPVVPDGIQQQQLGQQFDSLHGTDIHWKSTLLQQQSEARGIQYASIGAQKYPAPVLGVPNHETMVSPFYLEQPGMRFGVKEERIETDKLHKPELDRNKNDSYTETEANQLDAQQLRLQQRLTHPFMRSHFPQGQWHNPLIEKDPRKEDQLQKRKTVQSPRVSGGPLVQSPASSKSGEFPSGSLGPQFGAVTATAALGSLTKEKTCAISGITVGGAPSATSSPNDPMQQQHQAPVKRRSNSLPKTPVMSGVASPASVSNISVPLNEKSPSVGTPPLDQVMLERFSKIEAVTRRHQLGCKKNKVDDHPAVRKPMVYSTQQLSFSLSNVNNEDLKDAASERQLSKSFIGGSMNICKTRVLTFLQTGRFQGNVTSVVHKARSKLIMSEKPNGGTVAMYYGDIDDVDILAVEDYLPTLPNTHYADLLASQFCSLMTRDGYQLADDQIQLKPTHMIVAPNGQSTATGNPAGAAAEMQQYAEQVSGQPSNAVGTPTISGAGTLNSSQNLVTSTRMLPPGNTQALQISQEFLPGVAVPARPQQLDPQQPLQQQQNQHSLMQQQHAQFQRSPLMLPTNPLSHLNAIGQNSNMQMPSQMVNKSSHFPLQLLQQQQQQQQQPQQQQQQQQQQPQPQQQQLQPPPSQMQRKMIMGLGTAMGMGNMGNNMVNLGGLANVMGMGGVRGMGGAANSSPMGAMSGMGNMGQNPLALTQGSNISNFIQQHLRSGTLTHAQATAMAARYRMAQSRAGMSGGGPQAGITGIPGTGQMHPGSPGLSMLGQTLNRAGVNSLQRSAMAPMGPPKMIPGPNLYVNQQQQQQQQIQQLQQQQQIQQLQQQQQQQQISSPLQAVISPSQVGSPVAMAIQQQMNQSPQPQISPQQMNQQTPMNPQQLSSGALQPMSAGNAGAGPASPQLSSQTLGSVGSITSSPMELQGVNKGNSVGNV